MKKIWDVLSVFIPTFIGRVGFILLGFVDSLVLARYNATHLGYQSIADMPIGFFCVIIQGLTQGVLFQTTIAYGAKKYKEAGDAFHLAIKQSLLLSLPFLLLAPFSKMFFTYMNNPEAADTISNLFLILLAGIPFAVLYSIGQLFLQGIKKPMVCMTLVLIANVLNFILNNVLVFGMYGFPEWGAYGTVVTTTTIRMFLVLSVLAYIWFMKDHALYGIRQWHLPPKEQRKLQRKLGLGALLNIVSEEGTYAVNMFIASLLTLSVVAVYSLAFRTMYFIFIIAVTIAVTSAFYVGKAFGEKNIRRVFRIIWSGCAACAITMILIGVGLYWARDALTAWITTDIEVRQALPTLLAIVSSLLLWNGLQALFIIDLRTLRDIWVPTLIKAVTFGLMPLLSWIFCFVYDGGAPGLMASVWIVNALCCLAFMGRMIYLNKTMRL